ncbi:DNA repair protein RAD16 [Histoplasma capsulatum G186AR]|uniref:DNA repair protein RAD16 n=1 Tax=Ajellomyces capsulatus TaxID=5037 RepID=A0A8H7YJU2_AJECA|nr:DNA repair protein RAD16 [Histoplasma capsulatum]QSS68596.1 DNA repair protein RAD16 [Histoplasma capsulatum G186AR]
MANDPPSERAIPSGLANNKYSASLRKRGPGQRSRSSLNPSVANSASSDGDDSIDELLKAPRKRAKPSGRILTPNNGNKPAVMVEVSIGPKLPFTSPSSSTDAGGISTTNGDTTPATTANVTPAEPANPNKKRVNATARFLELRSSTLGLMGSKRVANSMSTDVSPDESADENLARALQAAEYSKNPNQNPRYSGGRRRSLRPKLIAPLPARRRASQQSLALASTSTRGKLRAATLRDNIPDSEESSLSELDSSANPDTGDSVTESSLSDEGFSEGDATDGDASDPDSSDGDSGDGDSSVMTTRRPRRAITVSRHPNPRIRSRNAAESRITPRTIRERRKLEQQHPIIQTMWDDLKKSPMITLTPAVQPPGISRKLKSFQLEGLNWMIQQEKSQWKGGLLGDEMGMGKTIQAVSLLMSDYPIGRPSLVVVPPVALMQWQSEIEQYTDGKLKVLIHHGSNSKVKNLSAKQLMAYDVIMISYAGLESMHRKEVKGWKRNDGLVKEDSVIHSIHFHRLILDEAHNIKQRTTSVAKACFALKSTYKWCLSGTPVQNRIGEFFSLLRFLEVKPFACYFCKVCPCQELHWSQDAEKRCTHCYHSGFSHVSIFNQEILNPITESRRPADRKAGLEKLRCITDRLMLRRVKQDHTASMELPPKRVILHNEFFGEIERDFSTSIMTNTVRQFDTYVSRGVMLNNYANIFGLIMQMRQVANHPDLILKKHAEGGQNVIVCGICDEPAEEPIRSRCRHEFCRQCAKDYIRSFEVGTEPDCPRCHIPLSIDFEQPDIEQEDDQVKKNSIINRIKMENWTSSTKIEMLVYDLFKLRSKKRTHKSIVFSQFTSMLQLVEWRLRRVGFNTVMLDGSMTPAQRQKSIEHFMNNVDVEVFLVSLKAGGVALNLTEASRVFIVDPWWNPAAEWQSADRCHRIGQRRPCVITRLCIEDSVESRMVLLQEKKANMIRGTINKDQSEALEKLTPEDMQFLFRGN